MTNNNFNHVKINELINKGELYNAIRMARSHIADHGNENSQLEILQLAKLYYATGHYISAAFWIVRTNADPINKFDLEDKLKVKLPHFDPEAVVV